MGYIYRGTRPGLRRLPVEERFWQHVAVTAPNACWEWQAYRNRQGYGQFGMDRGRRAKPPSARYESTRYNPEAAHRVAWELTHGPPGALHVLHRCDNPSCCNPSHLFLGTPVDNNKDRDIKGRTARGAICRQHHPARGSRSGMAKLDETKVAEIRARHSAGDVSQQALADEYGIAQSKISAVIRRETWKHVVP